MGISTAERVEARRFEFSGGRDDVRRQTVEAALDAFSKELDSVSVGISSEA
jgi:nicotinamide mononucleotide (NMN) deamidase PncC